MMLDGLGDYVDQMRKALTESQQQIAASRERMKALAVRTDSKDGSLSVTLSGTGDLTALTFRNDDYLDMSAEELSALIVETVREAKGSLQKELLGLLPPSPVSGLTAAQLLDPDTDMPRTLRTDVFPWLGSDSSAMGR